MSLLLPALALLTAIAVAAILWPLFRRQPTTPRSSFEIGVYRDQLAEVERDRARGLIGADEAKAARLEIERRILRTAPIGPAAPERTGESGRLLVLGAALLVPVLALGLYAALGTPGLPDEPIAARNEPAPSQQPDIQAMVARLQERLEQGKGNLDTRGAPARLVEDSLRTSDARFRALLDLLAERTGLQRRQDKFVVAPDQLV